MRVLKLMILPALLAPAMASAPLAAAPTKDGQKMICKSQPTIGSRFGTRICHTKAEWEVIKEEAQRGFSEDMRTRYINTCREPGNCH